MRTDFCDEVKEWHADKKKYELWVATRLAHGLVVNRQPPHRPVFVPLLPGGVMYKCISLGLAGEGKMMQLEQ